MSFDREVALRRLAAHSFDVVVIGGGVTGCGVALDAAARGLRTALVEAADFASGTSSQSSKLVHGGLRYLQQHDFLLVREALVERQTLLRTAPHLVHPLPFLIPLFGRDGIVSRSIAKTYSVALWTYDLTAGLRIGHRHRRVPAVEALKHFPSLRADTLVDSFLYWDAQTDDARLTLALARTAAQQGAVLANYAPAVSFLSDPGGRLAGVRLEDGTEVRAAAVVNAAGVWAERVASLQGRPGGESDGAAIRPAKGVHLTVRARRLPCDFAAVLAVPGDRRSIFVVPWAADQASGPDGPGRFTYIGTTDTDYEGPLRDPQATAEDMDYVLRAVNHWTTADLTPDDVTGSWAGLRPLVAGATSARTADLSRRHRVTVSADGLVSVTGGKLTTYRRMASDAVDAVGRVLARSLPPSPTRRLPLVGAGPAPPLPLPPEASASLVARYGAEASSVAELATEEPDLSRPLVEGLPYLRAEAVWSARREMARTVEDVLSRRTRALMLDRDAALHAAGEVATLLGRELGWSPEEEARQVEAFSALVEAQREAARGGARAGARST